MAAENVVGIGVVVDNAQAIDAWNAMTDEVRASIGTFDNYLKALQAVNAENANAAKMVNATTDSFIRQREAIAATIGEADAMVASNTRIAASNAEVAASSLKAQESVAAGQAIALEKTAQNLAAAERSMSPMYNRLTKLEALGTPAILKAATWTVLGVGGVAYEGIKQYMNFNKLITQTITQAGVPASQMGFLTNMTENISKMTGVNLNDVANSLYRVASGTASWNNGLGATKKQLTDITTQVTKLQVLGNVPTGAASEQAARVITALVNSNLVGVGSSAARAAALTNAAVGSGDMRLADLVPGIGRGVLQSAKANGVSAQDMLAWIALQTSMGTTASVAGNYVKTGINLLANPSAQGTAALAMIGIQPGEMESLMAGPGGVQSAIATLLQSMKKFDPASNLVLYRDKNGNPRPGDSGMVGAVNKLQTWLVGELSPALLAGWKAGDLNAHDQRFVNDLILTKAYGGSKQFATMAALVNNPALFAGIENSMSAKSSLAYYNKSYGIASTTPSQQFHKDLASMQVDLVNIGKTMFPIFVDVVTGFKNLMDVLTKFKPLLFALAMPIAAVTGVAALSKVSGLIKSMYPIIGHGYSMYDNVATGISGGDKTTFFGSKVGTGGSTFRNAYAQKTLEAQAKMGEGLNKLGIGLDAERTAVVTNTMALEDNTITHGGVTRTSAGGGSVGGVGGAASKAEQTAATRVASDTKVAASATKAAQTLDNLSTTIAKDASGSLNMGAMFAEAGMVGKIGMQRGTPLPLLALGTGSGVTGTAITDMRNSSAFQADMIAMNARAKASRRLGLTLKSGETIAMGSSSSYTGPSPVIVGDIPSRLEASATPLASDVTTASKGIFSRIGSSAVGDIAGSALGFLGGPAGMMMMSMLLPAAMPIILSSVKGIIGTIGSWFGSSGRASAPAALHVLTGSASLASQRAAALTRQHAYQHLVNGKWVNDVELTAAGAIAQRNAALAYGGLMGQSMSAAQMANVTAYHEISGQGIYTAINKVGGLARYMALASNGNGPMMRQSDINAFEKTIMGDIPVGMKPVIRKIFQGASGKYTAQQLQQAVYRQLSQRVVTDKSIVSSVEKMDASSWAHILPQDYAKNYSGQNAILNAGKFLMNPGFQLAIGKTAAAAGLSQYAKQEMGVYTNDMAASKNTSLGKAADQALKAQAQLALKDSETFTKVLVALEKNKSIKLEPTTIGDLSGEIASKLQAQGLDATGIANAFASAIGVSGKALAGIVNSANATAKARK